MTRATAPLTRALRRSAVVLAALLVSAGVIALAMTQPTGAGVRHGPAVRADAQRLERWVRAVAHPRDFKHHEALDGTAMLITEQLRAMGHAPTEQVWTVDGAPYRNVRLLLGDPAAPRVVVGAHYDSYEALPAADDNASGVASVLELAHHFKEHPPPGAVELVFWSLEEPPFFRTKSMGSFVHAQSLQREGVQVRAMMSVETVGYFRDEQGSQSFPLPGATQLFNDKAEDVYVVADLGNLGLTRAVKRAMRAASSVPVRSINAPALISGVDWSDQLGFWRHGFPGVMVTDTAPNRNPNYHQASDTPDTLDYQHLAQVTQGLFEAIWVLTAPEG